jgi:hypothetical protein
VVREVVHISGDQASLLRELQAFRGGVIDTSTLIYLERLGLLPRTTRCFSLLLIPQVVAEYGAQPEGAVLMAGPCSGTTDEALCQTAHALQQPVLSEDKQVLRRARALNLSFYNSLMIILALCSQGHLPLNIFPELRDKLYAFSRYSPGVLAVGDAVYEALLRQTQANRR